jgi:hypothetical protein
MERSLFVTQKKIKKFVLSQYIKINLPLQQQGIQDQQVVRELMEE